MQARARAAFLAVLFAIPPASAACTDTANVSDGYMALDAQGNRKRENFFTDTATIFCVADFTSSRNDVTLNIKLHQLSRYDFTKNQFVPFDAYPTETEIAPGATSQSQQALQLLHQDYMGNQNDALPYPAGSFECEISVDGTLVKTVPFQIQFPPCPDTQILPNATCLGFYKSGDRCPELGVGSSMAINCTCTTVPGALSDTNLTGGNWQCDPIP